ncbi:MAG: YfhO family protein [Muribaculaceae bacterium]|nr:YfhO family protein [Muribaculaceae bacterium]
MDKNVLNKQLIGTLTVRSVVTFVLAILAFVAISWIYFSPSVGNGYVLQQHDVMQGKANGQEAKEYQEEHNGEVTRWTNSLFGGMPTFQIAPSYKSTSIINTLGKILTLGLPSPVSWVFLLMLGFFILMLAFDMKWYLAVLGAIGYAFSSYFFIIIAAGHIWKLLVLCFIPPTIAGIVWAYRGKYLLGTAVTALFASLQLLNNHVQMTYYSLFIIVPLVFAFLFSAIKEKKLKQWGIASACMAVAALLAVGANASNLYLSNKYAKETMRGGHSELTPLPEDKDKEQAKQAVPENDGKGGLSKEYITQWSYGIDETWTLMVPNVKGGASNPLADLDNAYTVVGGGDLEQELNDAVSKELGKDVSLGSDGLHLFTQYFGDQPGTSGPVYVGALIFALFILGLFVVKGPVKWALLAATIISIMLSWGHNAMWLTGAFIDYFPMYNKFRPASSILVIAEFTIPLLAVLALKEMLTQEDFFNRYKKVIYGVFGTCVFLCLLFAFMPSIFYGDANQIDNEHLKQIFKNIGGGEKEISITTDKIPQSASARAPLRLGLVTADAWRSLFVIVLGFGVMMLYKFRKINAVAVGLIISGIVLVDMYNVNKRYLNEEHFHDPATLPETTFVKTPADEMILADTTQNYRVWDVSDFGGARSSYFHKTIGGYHAAKLRRYNDLINRQIYKNNMAVLNMLNAKWVMINPQLAQQNPEALGNAWFVDNLKYVKTADEEMKFLDDFDPATEAVADEKFKETLKEATATDPDDYIQETTYAPNKLTYHSHSKNGGLAVFSEIYFPWGWTATIDGKEVPIGRVNYVLRALQVPAGDHTIVFTFDPQEVHKTEAVAKTSVWLILLLILGALGWAIYSGLRRKKDEAESAELEDSKKSDDTQSVSANVVTTGGQDKARKSIDAIRASKKKKYIK